MVMVAHLLSSQLIDYSLLDKFSGEFYSWTAFGGPQKKLLPSHLLSSQLKTAYPARQEGCAEGILQNVR